jgi:hypothetical protein
LDAADNLRAAAARADPAIAGETPSYEYRPSLLGAGWHFTLTPAGVEWSAGARSGFLPYGDVRGLRLSYRPTSMQSHRFVTEVWARKGPALRIVSTTWKSVAEQPRQDAAYKRFVGELHARVAATGVAIDCERGRPPLIYWPGLVVFVGVTIAMAALIVRALQFVRQGWLFFGRNRPGRYRVNELPASLLPKG